MRVRAAHPAAPVCCAFCRKPLPAVDRRIQHRRASNGLGFCNEYCADDAEELSFRNRVGGVAIALRPAPRSDVSRYQLLPA